MLCTRDILVTEPKTKTLDINMFETAVVFANTSWMDQFVYVWK